MNGDEAPLGRESFGALTAIASPVAIPPPEWVWSAADWYRLCRGHRAVDMDDKWNAFVDGTRLFLYRSWTGAGIFEAGFEHTDTGWRMVEAVAEPSDHLYRRGDEDVTSDLLFLITESVLLNRCHAEGWASAFLRLVPPAASGLDFDLWLHGMIGNRWGEFCEETSGS